MRLGRNLRLWRLWALRLAVVLPLMVLGLFPAGVMPGQGADGAMTLVICTGNGPMLMVVDPATGSLKKAPAAAPQAACDWAMTRAAAMMPLPAVLPRPPEAMQRARLALASPEFRPAHDPRGLYARGPPTRI